MLGKILKIEDKIIKVENLKKISLIDIIGKKKIFRNKNILTPYNVFKLFFINYTTF